MSLPVSRFYPFDLDFFAEGFPGTRGRHPLVPFEETHTSRMMQPKYAPISLYRSFRLSARPLTHAGQDGLV